MYINVYILGLLLKTHKDCDGINCQKDCDFYNNRGLYSYKRKKL